MKAGEKGRVLVADAIARAGVEVLQRAGLEVEELPATARATLPEALAGCRALVVRSMTRVTEDLLRAGDRLQVVGRAGVGLDNIDLEAAQRLGVEVVHSPTANLVSAAEHTMALLLALARRIPEAVDSLQQGHWARSALTGWELKGKSLGIVGLGRIGRLVAARASAFGMRISAYDPHVESAVFADLGVEALALDELLAESHVVTLHLPLNSQTSGLLGVQRIAAMRPGAYLVNCGRGGLVDEAALLEALEEGRLAGAALDVFATEPPDDLRLARHPRVIATPHLGAKTREAIERVAVEMAESLVRVLSRGSGG